MMKRILLLLSSLLLLFGNLSMAAEPAAVGVWPDRIDRGEVLVLSPPSDSGGWGFLPANIRHWVLEDGTALVETVRAKSITVAYAHTVDGRTTILMHRVIVGEDPEPEPDPDPIPPPPPGDLAVVLIIEAKSTPTIAQAATIAGLEQYLDEQKIWRRTVDQHKPDGLTGKTPAYLAPGLEEMTKKGLTVPVLTILVKSDKGGFVAVDVDAIPATAEKAIAKVARYVK